MGGPPSGHLGPLRTWKAVAPLLPKGAFRRVDYWIRSGSIRIARNAQGSGFYREFSDDDVRKLRCLFAAQEATKMHRGSGGASYWEATLIAAVWEALDWGCPVHLWVEDDWWQISDNAPTTMSAWITINPQPPEGGSDATRGRQGQEVHHRQDPVPRPGLGNVRDAVDAERVDPIGQATAGV